MKIFPLLHIQQSEVVSTLYWFEKYVGDLQIIHTKYNNKKKITHQKKLNLVQIIMMSSNIWLYIVSIKGNDGWNDIPSLVMETVTVNTGGVKERCDFTSQDFIYK
jgi:hypothetical protein